MVVLKVVKILQAARQQQFIRRSPTATLSIAKPANPVCLFLYCVCLPHSMNNC